jgi:hypothetical protein
MSAVQLGIRLTFCCAYTTPPKGKHYLLLLTWTDFLCSYAGGASHSFSREANRFHNASFGTCATGSSLFKYVSCRYFMITSVGTNSLCYTAETNLTSITFQYVLLIKSVNPTAIKLQHWQIIPGRCKLWTVQLGSSVGIATDYGLDGPGI